MKIYLCEKLQNNVCVQILKHKIYFITPLLLDKWNVPYTFVLQNPGDLFFIKRGTYHAVINLGKNIAEAVNYGSVEWVGDYEPPVCKCEENRKNDIKQDITVVVTKKALKRRLIQCSEGCGNVFTTSRKLQLYERLVHGKMCRFECANCSKVFHEKMSLVRHVKTHFVKEKKKCNICGKSVLNLSLHMISAVEFLQTRRT